MRTMFKNIFLTTALIMACSTSAWAQAISVSATVDSTEVEVGSSIGLNVNVSGTQDVEAPQAPSIDGFDVQYVGPSQQVTIVNGRYSSSITFVYSLLALKTGEYQIPALTLNIDGTDHHTQPIAVRVADAAASGDPASGTVTASSLKDKIYLEMELPRMQAYVNEKLPVTLRFYVAGIAVRDIEYPKLENDGLKMGEYTQPQRSQQVKNGINYDVVEFQTFIFPTREGQLNVGPAKLNCSLLIKKQRQSQGLSGMMGDDFFDSFFDQAEKRPLTVASNDLSVEILPLLSEGKPVDFSGAVGNFNLEATASPLQVKVGDPVTVKITISGDGNFEGVTLPHLKEDKDFKMYEANIRDNNGAKVVEQVVIPLSISVTEIPAVTFSYFDPQAKSYKSLTQGPFAVHVDKADESSAKVVGDIDPPRVHGSEQLGEDIVFIKEDLGKLFIKGKRLYDSPVFFISIIILAGIYGGLLFYLLKKQRLETDTAYAHKFHAPKQARKDLAAASAHLQAGQGPQFYDSLFKAMQNYFSRKLHLPPGAVNTKNILSSAQGSRFDTAVQNDIKQIFEHCDQVRYASVDLGAQVMQNDMTKVEQIIERCERLLK